MKKFYEAPMVSELELEDILYLSDDDNIGEGGEIPGEGEEDW